MAKLNKIVFRKAPKPLSHASPYSIPVYRKLGFIETDNMLEENGIRYLPMERIIRLQKYNLSYTQKERIVDRIVQILFPDLRQGFADSMINELLLNLCDDNEELTKEIQAARYNTTKK